MSTIVLICFVCFGVFLLRLFNFFILYLFIYFLLEYKMVKLSCIYKMDLSAFLLFTLKYNFVTLSYDMGASCER